MDVVLLDAAGTNAALSERPIALGVNVLDHCDAIESALDVLTGIAPDVVIVEPSPWGPRVITRLQAATRAPVLVISARPQLDHVLACLDAGAAGYLTADLDATQWKRALQDAAEGRAPLSADVSKLLLPLLRDRRETVEPPVDLTDRERNVLSLLVHGHAYAAIADALGIGLGTVQSHVKNLYRKLDVCTKAEAATIALRQGLLSVQPERRRSRIAS